MRLLTAAFLLSISVPAFADNIAGCEVVLMETIKQEGLEGSAEVASFRPAADFIASIYDDETDVMREIDGLPIRAVMCKRKSVVPSLRDFPIVATGTPFMISQNFESTESGLTTIYFKDGEFRSSYKGPELDEDIAAEMADRLEVFNLQPHDLAEKEKAMLEKATLGDETEEVDAEEESAPAEEEAEKDHIAEHPSSEKEMEDAKDTESSIEEPKEDETPSTDEADKMDDSQTESTEEESAPEDDGNTESEELEEKSE